MRPIVTAPHATCPSQGPTEQHFCEPWADVIAEEVAMATGTVAHIGDRPRTEVDLNRSDSRGSPFRDKVAGDMGEKSLVIDVHTAPPQTFGVDIALFNIPGSPPELVEKLRREVESKGYSVGVVEGSVINDISMEAVARGGQAVLVEVSEALDPRKVGKVLGEAVRRLL